MADKALRMMEIDEIGLDFVDRRILSTMIDKFDGGPVGLDTLAASTGEESITIEDVYEPYLLQIGFIARTPRGRIALKAAYAHLNKPYSDEQEQKMKQLETEELNENNE
jgi:Holliday junction DNA helicase RuvB